MTVSRRDFLAVAGGAAAGAGAAAVGAVAVSRPSSTAASLTGGADEGRSACCDGRFVDDDGWMLTADDAAALRARRSGQPPSGS